MSNSKILIALLCFYVVLPAQANQAAQPTESKHKEAKPALGSVTVNLNGRMNLFAGGVHQPTLYSRKYSFVGPSYVVSDKLINRAFVNDTKLDVAVHGTSENGLEYGGLIRLHADTSDATNDEDSIADKTMLFIQSNKFGRIEGGNYPGAGAMFEMDISTYAKAAYGVDGYWVKWINDVSYIDLTALGLPGSVPFSGLVGFRYLASPNLPSNYSGFSYSDAPKLTYYTKPLEDWTIGVSYIPDLDSTGTIKGAAPMEEGAVDSKRAALGYRSTFKNIISGGMQYKHKMAGLTTTVNLAGEIGKAKRYNGIKDIRDLRAYELGLILSYDSYAIGASYGNWGKTGTYRQPFAGSKQGSSYWTLMASRQQEKLGYSLTYMQSKRAGGLEAVGSQFINIASGTPMSLPYFADSSYNKFRAASAGVQYLVAPGLLPFAELTGFHFRSAQEPVANKGYVGLTGIRLTF